jgi:hypothetical protein
VAGAVQSAGAQFQQFSSETLPETRNLIAELRALSSSLRRFSEELASNPAILVHGRPKAERGPGE